MHTGTVTLRARLSTARYDFSKLREDWYSTIEPREHSPSRALRLGPAQLKRIIARSRCRSCVADGRTYAQ